MCQSRPRKWNLKSPGNCPKPMRRSQWLKPLNSTQANKKTMSQRMNAFVTTLNLQRMAAIARRKTQRQEARHALGQPNHFEQLTHFVLGQQLLGIGALLQVGA